MLHINLMQPASVILPVRRLCLPLCLFCECFCVVGGLGDSGSLCMHSLRSALPGARWRRAGAEREGLPLA